MSGELGRILRRRLKGFGCLLVFLLRQKATGGIEDAASFLSTLERCRCTSVHPPEKNLFMFSNAEH
jgi:phosphoglycerate dehydrogenase-like enzyme